MRYRLSVSGSPKRRILVVDDDRGWVDLLDTMLSDDEFFVFAVTAPEQALAFASLYEIDLAILDWKLADPVSGIELGRRLQVLRPDLKCILISGHPQASVREQAFAAGFCDFLDKPFDVEDLRVAVEESLREAA